MNLFVKTCLYHIVIGLNCVDFFGWRLNCVIAKICCFKGCWRNAQFAMAIWSTRVHAILAEDFIVSGLLAPSTPRILQGNKNQSNYQVLFSILLFQMYFHFLKSFLLSVPKILVIYLKSLSVCCIVTKEVSGSKSPASQGFSHYR